MHQVKRQAIVKYSADNMFSLVNRVEDYPKFLNWCHESHIMEESKEHMIAGMTISLVGIKQKFTTKNQFSKDEQKLSIELSLIKGPFDKLSGYWTFTYLNENASKIELDLSFNFKSNFLNTTFKRAFGKIAQQLVSDFVQRASYVYR
jgi:ribosome-associated toxin RatA of RatAB toxin-antitoxin module